MSSGGKVNLTKQPPAGSYVIGTLVVILICTEDSFWTVGVPRVYVIWLAGNLNGVNAVASKLKLKVLSIKFPKIS